MVPAATLLIPYFEVDLDDPSGRTTLFSVNNARAESVLAQVTLWTDWAVPTLSFPVYLTGFDVQSFNVRSLLVDGVLPATGTGLSPHGELSGEPEPFPGCGGGPAPLSAAEMAELRALHTGRPAPSSGLCAASPRLDETLATGYVTVDVVRRCAGLTPADPAYFSAGSEGVAGFDNALWGDVALVDPGENFAHGDTAVHLEADPDRFFGNTFYRRYTGGRDHRQPLGTRYATRYLVGGPFSGGTELVVWRDSGSSSSVPVACGEAPAWAPMEEHTVLAFDEEENPAGVTMAETMMMAVNGRVEIGGGEMTTPDPFGWLVLDLGIDDPFTGPGQAWVSTVLAAEGRYSVGLPAVQLDDPCAP